MNRLCGRLGAAAALIAFLLAGLAPAVAQQPDPLQITVHHVDSADFPRVTVYATVADSRGIPIDGLTRTAFSLVEDGQPVRADLVTVSPSERPDRPVSLVLALDISNSLGAEGVEGVRSAALTLIDSLPPAARDRIALITFGNPNEYSINIEHDFTDDRAALRETITGLTIGPTNAYTAFWGAAYESLALLESDPQAAAARRRAVIILTDGIDNSAAGARFLPENTQRTSAEVVAYAQRLGTPIYPISFGRLTDEAALEQLALATQGISYIGTTPRDLELAFADVLATLRKEYRVDFTSALPADDAAHDLDIRVTHQAFTTVAKTRFTAPARPVQVRLNLEEGQEVSGSVLVQPVVEAAGAVVYGRLNVNGAPLQEFGAGDIRYTWNTTQLASGSYTLELFVRDSAGNTGQDQRTVTVVEPLSVRITAPAPNARLAGEVDIVYEAISNVASLNVVSLLVDGREVASRIAPEAGEAAFVWDTSAADLGGHQLEVRARDTLGNQVSAFVVVNVVPALSVRIAAPAPNAAVSGEVGIAYTAEVNVAPARSASLLVDGVPYAIAPGDGRLFWNADAAPLGRHTLEVRVVDAAGNTASDSVTVNVSRPLGVAIVAPDEGARVAGAVGVTFRLTGHPSDVSAVRFFVDDLELRELTADLALEAGENTLIWDTTVVEGDPAGRTGLRKLAVQITDTLGNTQTATTFVNVVEPLVVRVESPAPGAQVDGEVRVVYAVEANAAPPARVLLSVDGVPYVTAVGGPADRLAPEEAESPPVGEMVWNASQASLGAHTLEVIAIDQAGNRRSVSVPVVVARSLAVSFDAPTQGAQVAGQVLVRFNLQGNPADVAHAEFWVEGRRIAALTDLRAGANALTWDAEATGTGLRQLEIRLTDTTGRQHTAATVVNVVEPLVVRIAAPAPNARLDASAGEIEVGYAVEANAGFIRRVALLVNGVEVADSVSLEPTGVLSWDPSEAPLGSHTLAVAVTDSNDYRATASVSVTLTRPLSARFGLPPGARVAGSAVEIPFVFTGRPADVAGAAFFVDDRRVASLAALQEGENTLTWDATAVELGLHTLELRLTDTLGNEAASTVTVNVVEPLAVRITAPAPNTTLGDEADISYDIGVNAGRLARVALLVNGVEVTAAEDGAPTGTLAWDTRAFALGAHTLEVVAVNDVGDAGQASIPVNVARPLRVAIQQPAPRSEVAGRVEVRFELEGRPADVARAIFLVDDRRVQTLVGLRAGENSLQWDASSAALGPHTLEVRLTDTLGNEATSTVTVSVAEPLSVRITAPAPNATLRGPVRVDYAVAARAAALYDIALRVDGVEVAAAEELDAEGAFTWESDAAPLGAHTLEVVAVDAAGNEARASVAVEVARPLRVAMQQPVSGQQVAGWVDVQFTLEGRPSDIARAAFLVDDRHVTSLGNLVEGVNMVRWNATAAGLGLRAIEVRVVDTTGALAASDSAIVNVIPPLALSITAPVPNAEVAGAVAVRYRAQANAADLSRVTLLVNGETVAASDAPDAEGALIWDASDAPLGVYLLELVAEDADGNAQSAEVSVTLVKPVVLEVLSPVQNEAVAGVVRVRFNVQTNAAALDRVTLLVDGEEVATLTEGREIAWDTNALAPGLHRVELRAVDQAGYEDAQTLSVSVLRPVVVRVLSPAPGARVAGEVEVSFSAESNAAALSRVSLMVDDELVAALDRPPSVGSLIWDSREAALGLHRLTVRAEDSAGNVHEARVMVTLTEPLAVDLTAPAQGERVTGTVPVRYQAAVTGPALQKVTLEVDGEAVETLTSPAAQGVIPWETSSLRLGTHEVAVVLENAAGDTQRAAATVVVTRPLAVAVISPAVDEQVSGEVQVRYQTNAALDEIAAATLLVNHQEVRSVRGPLADTVFNWDTNDLGAGMFTLAVSVRDVTGQTQTSAPVAVQVIFQGNTLPIFLAVLALLFVLVILVPLALRRRRQLIAGAGAAGMIVAGAAAADQKAYLVSESGSTSGTRWLLTESETVVGRSRTRADVVVTGRTASRQHARISRRGEAFIYTDLSAENPSNINGEVLTGPHTLQDGDVIEVGDTRLRFVRDA